MNTPTEGIVLKSNDYGEGNVIAHVLTENHGRVQAVFKGLKKSSRRSFVSSETGALSQFVFSRIVDDKPLIVQESSLIDIYPPIRQNLRKIIHLNYLMEIILKTSPMHSPDNYLFRMLKAALAQLSSTSNEYHLLSFFTLHLLRLHGILPSFDKCSSCKQNLDDDYHLSISEKGLLCPVCARIPRGSFLKITVKQRAFAMECLSNKFSSCDMTILNEEEASSLLYPLVVYIEQYFHSEIRSKPFLFSDDLLGTDDRENSQV